jgi:hypothetical protein
MNALRVAPDQWQNLKDDLLSTPELERAAIGFAGIGQGRWGPQLLLREERGYISGINEPAPAVVSINGVIASAAVTELLARWTGFAGQATRADLLLYRLADGSLRRTSPRPSLGCPTCGTDGLRGAGDLASPPW